MEMKFKSEKNLSFMCLIRVATVFVAVYYVALCVRHLLSVRPLWLDESMVFESLKNFAPGDFFTQRLASGQIFPKFYLFLIQCISEPFALNLLSVRFLSFVMMLGAFVLWLKIAKYEFRDKALYLIYLLSWAASSQLVYYSAELKPYSMDVFVSGLFVLFLYNADKLLKERPPMYLGSIALLPFMGIVSYPAFLFYVFLAYHLMTIKVKKCFWLLCFLFFCISVLASFGFVYYFDIRLAHATTSSQGFSDHIVSFASVGEFFKTFGDGTTDLFCRFFAERPRVFKRIAVVFGLIGFLAMLYSFIRNFRLSGYRFNSFRTIALVLYAQLFLLGALQKYPFSVPRTSLFFCPLVLLLIIEGIGYLKKINQKLSRVLCVGYVIFLLVIASGIGREAFGGFLSFAPLIWQTEKSTGL